MDKIFSVSQYLALVNESLLPLAEAVIEGEVSEFKISREKWVGFKLKDPREEAVVDCFLVLYKLRVPLADGMRVRVWGRPRVYPRYGKFSVAVTHIELAGEGSLKRAFEITRARLEAEGLFDPARKRPLPQLPQTIGLITSGEAAAYSDFTKVAAERYGGLTIHWADVPVQGRTAPAAIVAALDHFAGHWRRLGLEAIVLIRGGGSLEDLQSFNDEGVARAVFRSPVPVLVGVGHERDVTLCDYVADVRAATPSNAAELLVPSRGELNREIDQYFREMESRLKALVQTGQSLAGEAMFLGGNFIAGVGRELTDALNDLDAGLRAVAYQLTMRRRGVEYEAGKAGGALTAWLRFVNQTLERELGLLISYDPRAVLRRGYGIVRLKKDRSLVKTSRQVRRNDQLEVELAKGGLEARVETVN